MSKNRELVNVIMETAAEINGTRKLSCAEAFRLAEKFNVEKMEIGRTCDSHKIKICSCQLGCFK